MVSFDYAFYHIERTLKMAWGEPAMLEQMDISAEGFWRSFAAILFAFPAMFFGWVMDGRDLIAQGLPRSMNFIVVTTGVLELLIWLLPILVLAFVLKPLGYAHRFTHLIIVRNWFSVPIAYLYAFLAVPMLLQPGYQMPVFLLLLTMFLLLYIIVRLTRSCLECDAAVAWALVIGEFVLIAVLIFYIQDALGFYDATSFQQPAS